MPSFGYLIGIVNHAKIQLTNLFNKAFLYIFMIYTLQQQGAQAILNTQDMLFDSSELQKEKLDPIQKKSTTESILHRSLVAIRCPTSKNIKYGSGILIAKDIVLTAAHHLFDVNQKEQADKQKCQVFLDCDTSRSFKIKQWIFMQEYKQKGEIQYDFALIKLKDDEHLPIFDQYLQICTPCLDCLNGQKRRIKLNIHGYSFNLEDTKPQGAMEKGLKIEKVGVSKQVETKLAQNYGIIYQINTFSSLSGCPIIQNNKIIAIHETKIEKQPFNIGRLLTYDLLRKVQQWKQIFQRNSEKQLLYAQIKRQIQRQRQKQQEQSKIQGIENQRQTFWSSAKNTLWRGIVKFCYVLMLFFYLCSILIRPEQSYIGAEPAGQLKEITKTLNDLGQQYYNQGNQVQSIKCFMISLRIYQLIGIDIRPLINDIFRKSLQNFDAKDYKNAMKYSSMMLEIAQKSKIQSLIAISCMNVGATHSKLQQFSQALRHYYLAQQYFNSYKTKNGLLFLDVEAPLFGLMGQIFQKQRNYDKALNYYSSYLVADERVKGKGTFMSAKTCKSMAEIYAQQHKYDQSISYYKSSLQGYEKQYGKGSIKLGDIFLALGQIYGKKIEYSQAIRYYNLALPIFQVKQDKRLAKVLQELGNSYLLGFSSTQALEYYQKARVIYQKLKLKDRDYFYLLYTAGTAYFSMSNQAKTVEFYQRSLQVLKLLQLNYESKRGFAQSIATHLNMLNRRDVVYQIIVDYNLNRNQF